jgi:hypothetical protein
MDFKIPNHLVQKSFKLIIFLENGLHNVIVGIYSDRILLHTMQSQKNSEALLVHIVLRYSDFCTQLLRL